MRDTTEEKAGQRLGNNNEGKDQPLPWLKSALEATPGLLQSREAKNDGADVRVVMPKPGGEEMKRKSPELCKRKEDQVDHPAQDQPLPSCSSRLWQGLKTGVCCQHERG